MKASENLESMIKRILGAGFRANYLLMDSWFMMRTTVTALSKHIHVLSMIKKRQKFIMNSRTIGWM
ncbi:MAG: hypothetical protein CSA29_04330 [Desulfobacterales bacterium]|nr:MAG: hypothetical protein CSA29_04330 [Desulfobacterales bacterium]